MDKKKRHGNLELPVSYRFPSKCFWYGMGSSMAPYPNARIIVKMNVDTVATSNLGDLATVGLYRDTDSTWLFGLTGKLRHGHITKAELYAFYNDLHLA
ncbi:hypothetical protein J1N35_032538 [Gossypium stocksii]|uniref:Uncharacterized protein n=1 Tax=Gossypium stocksii TaxID=47602 RepID=A0A9D3ZUT7_9ROSI|nr:hypothetical protein J1N35_032538 [Gossypium stocksii]